MVAALGWRGLWVGSLSRSGPSSGGWARGPNSIPPALAFHAGPSTIDSAPSGPWRHPSDNFVEEILRAGLRCACVPGLARK